MRNLKFYKVCALPILLSACATELNAIRVRDASDLPLSGAPYNLTFTQFELSVVHQVHCFDIAEDVGSTALISDGYIPQPKVFITTDVSLKKREVKDLQHTYVIDFASVEGFFKATDLNVEYYESGALKTINATVEDRSQEFLSSVIKTVGTVATPFVAGLGDFSAERPRAVPESEWRCHPEIALASLRVAKNKAEARFLATDLAEKNAKLSEYADLLKNFKAGTSEVWSKNIKSLMSDIVSLRARQRLLQGQLNADLKKTSLKQEFTWPLNGSEFFSDGMLGRLDGKEIERWILPVRGTKPSFQTGFFLELRPAETIAVTTPSCANKICSTDASPGIKYRIPALGELLKCTDTNIDIKAMRAVSCKTVDKLITDVPISQLGKVFVLPLKSRPFGKRGLSLAFTEGGLPIKIGVNNAGSSDKAAEFGSTLGGNIATLSKSNAERETNQLEAKIKLLTLRKQYEEAKAQTGSDE